LKRQAIKEEKPKVPAYIVTFSDMTTLLLTFFVMLLSLATVQDDEMFHKGRESFSYAIKTFGLGMLVGRKPKPDLGYYKVKYYMDEPNEAFVGRSINTKEEKIRKLFNELNRSMKCMPSVMAANKTDFTVTNIRFAQGDARLDESAKQFLGEPKKSSGYFLLSGQRRRRIICGVFYLLDRVPKHNAVQLGAGLIGLFIGGELGREVIGCGRIARFPNSHRY